MYKFDEDKSTIITRKKETYNLDDCYLRACIKKIYLHVDSDKPPKTLILGKTDNPFYENSDLEDSDFESTSDESNNKSQDKQKN